MSHHFDSTSMWLYMVAPHGMHSSSIYIYILCNLFVRFSQFAFFPSSLRSPAKITIVWAWGRGIHESSATALATEMGRTVAAVTKVPTTTTTTLYDPPFSQGSSFAEDEVPQFGFEC